jgi:hypothetical protein
MKIKSFLLFFLASASLIAQQAPIQYFRTNDKEGLHVFETTKRDSLPFDGMKVRIGGNFTQDFQALKQQNNAVFVNAAGSNANELVRLIDGFNLAMANLNIDAQLANGVRLNVSMYLSSRHHEETWVKAGYIQFDKLPFIKSNFIDNVMKTVTVKVGDLEVDYGDQHFRRTDGGNAIYNPFIENHIMDQFATEIGAEVYYHPQNGFIAMVGMTNGQLNPSVVAPVKIDLVTGKSNKNAPAFHAKLGYDKQLNEAVRVRLTGSIYAVSSSSSNTLFFGDRAGSHYFMVMENTAGNSVTNAWSGRYNPGFSQEVTTFMLNPFLKYKGIELFGTYEMAQGRKITEIDLRKVTQYAADLIYRFPAIKENFWIGTRFNTLTAAIPFATQDVTINRIAGSAGWFMTKNIMVKGEYINQVYMNFDSKDIRSGGQFNGFMLEAVVGF